MGYSPWGRKELDTTEHPIFTHILCPPTADVHLNKEVTRSVHCGFLSSVFFLSLFFLLLSPFLFFLFLIFWLCCVACGILVPQPGTEPVPPVLGRKGLSHWITMEVPCLLSEGDQLLWFTQGQRIFRDMGPSVIKLGELVTVLRSLIPSTTFESCYTCLPSLPHKNLTGNENKGIGLCSATCSHG